MSQNPNPNINRVGRDLPFIKMHGCGNDFIMLNGFAHRLPADMNGLAARLCRRNFSIGADGVIALYPAEGYDFRMRLFQPDGSEAEMCGNGVRCAALFAQLEGICQKQAMRVITLAGEIQPRLLPPQSGALQSVQVNMGLPRLLGPEVPCTLGDGRIIEAPLEIDGREFGLTAVSMGNPHGVIFLEGSPQNIAVEHFGPLLERHQVFPAKANIEFVQAIDGHNLQVRVWERGVGETCACGTGACASAVAAILTGRAQGELNVHLPGGSLQISWSGQPDAPVYMSGPAEVSFRGSVSLQEESL